MKESLHRKLEILNQETEQIHASLAGLSEENLHDTSYGWSIIQVMSHLNMAEGGSLMYMKKKMQAGDDMSEIGLGNRIRLFFSRYFMQSNLKWKAPAVVSKPKGDYSYNEIKEKWTDTRNAFKDYIDAFPEQYLNKLVMKHPLSGRLNLGGALDACIYHQRHHVHQIKRIRKKISV